MFFLDNLFAFFIQELSVFTPILYEKMSEKSIYSIKYKRHSYMCRILQTKKCFFFIGFKQIPYKVKATLVAVSLKKNNLIYTEIPF